MATKQELINKITLSIQDLGTQSSELITDTAVAAFRFVEDLAREGNTNSAESFMQTLNIFMEAYSIPLLTLVGILADLLELYSMLGEDERSVLLQWLREVNGTARQAQDNNNV